MAFAARLPQVFLLSRDEGGRFSVRLAGEQLRELFGRDLKGRDFAELWEGAARTPLRLSLEAVRRRAEPAVVHAAARAGASEVRFECLLAPLADADGRDRILGHLQASGVSPARGPSDPRLSMISVVSISEQRPGPLLPKLRLAAVNGQRLA